MGQLILSIDLGTTAVKVAVFDFDGVLQCSETVEYELSTPKVNWVEAPPDIYMQAIKQALIKLQTKADLSQTRGIGFSAQGETLFFLDENGKPLRDTIVWMDNRADKEAIVLREIFGDEQCYEVTGQISFEPCWPAAKVLWVKNNEPEVFNKTKKILLIEDYIIYCLTGRYVSEGSLLTSTEYWDIRTKKYWPQMLEAIGISEELLPEIYESGQPVGKILPDIAAELGISEEALVCTGCLDQAAGAIGVGNILPGMFSENIGAALAICAPTAELVYDPARMMPVHYFAFPDTYMIHTFTTGGMALRWFRDNFCKEEMSVASYTDMDAYDLLSMEVDLTPAGSEGLIMLPHLNGAMPPDMNAKARGVFYGFTMKHGKRHFVRSIMESIGYIIRRNFEALEEQGIEVTELRSLGGGSRSSAWSQIKADILGVDLYTCDCKEAACLGAAILAGKAMGLFDDVKGACERMVRVKEKFSPDKDNRLVYENLYSEYKQLFGDLADMFDKTALHQAE